jgi:type I restriction enzyme M protein
VLGNEGHYDWNQVWDEVQKIVKRLPDDQGWAKSAKGTAQKKTFRDAFTEVDPEAEPVIAKVHKEVELDFDVLFPGQDVAHTKARSHEEIQELLGLNRLPSPSGRGAGGGEGRYVEYEADANLKDFENIPLKEDVISYVLREVRPYVADAWIDRDTLDEQDGGIGKVGFEINFNREFFQYQPPRPLAEIDAELEAVEKRIMGLLREVTE